MSEIPKTNPEAEQSAPSAKIDILPREETGSKAADEPEVAENAGLSDAEQAFTRILERSKLRFGLENMSNEDMDLVDSKDMQAYIDKVKRGEKELELFDDAYFHIELGEEEDYYNALRALKRGDDVSDKEVTKGADIYRSTDRFGPIEEDDYDRHFRNMLSFSDILASLKDERIPDDKKLVAVVHNAQTNNDFREGRGYRNGRIVVPMTEQEYVDYYYSGGGRYVGGEPRVRAYSPSKEQVELNIKEELILVAKARKKIYDN